MASSAILLVACILNIATGHNVTLYSLFNGMALLILSVFSKCSSDNNQTLEIDVRDLCVNIPGSFLALNGGVSGVGTHGICTVVYSVCLFVKFLK